MAVDEELERHQETWQGFTRVIQGGVALIVSVLLLLALQPVQSGVLGHRLMRGSVRAPP